MSGVIRLSRREKEDCQDIYNTHRASNGLQNDLLPTLSPQLFLTLLPEGKSRGDPIRTGDLHHPKVAR